MISRKFLRSRDRAFNFFATPSKLKYTLIIAVTGAVIALLIYWGEAEWETICSALLSILFVWALGALLKRIMYLNEDRRKVTSDNDVIGKIYDRDKYLRCLEIEGKKQSFYYEISYRHDDRKKIVIRDNPSKKYALPGKIDNHFTNLLSAHGNSFIENKPTVRLDRYEETDSSLILETSRSDFYSHLATNRAMDYLIDRKVSIRALYEYGPFLSPLEESELSNHIGINALIFLNDGAVILKHRNSSSTISKNCLTSSVATRLIIDDHREKITYSKEKMNDPILTVMFEKLNFPRSAGIEIDFLGFARDVYEGGKPQFYFDVRVDMSSKEYLGKYCRGECSQKCREIDEDKAAYVCSRVYVPDDESDKLEVFYYDLKAPDNIKSRTLFPERSLYVNMYLSKEFKTRFNVNCLV